ncbi:hypothetical protein, partial [Klebsiella pneumoniae]|uniref:hypothetical protein n=1 Tax=Klebsiella pneumoniae TaxID=573 RepID=UPI0030140D52
RRLKKLGEKNRRKNKGKKATSTVADAAKPTLTQFVLPTGATYKDTKTETKDGSTTIHREVAPKPTKCPKAAKKSKRSYEVMDELD